MKLKAKNKLSTDHISLQPTIGLFVTLEHIVNCSFEIFRQVKRKSHVQSVLVDVAFSEIYEDLISNIRLEVKFGEF